MRFSLKEFLVIVGVASAGMASLIYANDLVAGLWMGLVFLMMVAMAIRIVILRRRPEPFQVGFLIAVLAYTAVLASLWYRHDPNGDRRNQEFEPSSGWLPTSILMRRPYAWVSASRSYVEDANGNRYKRTPAGYRLGSVDDFRTSSKVVVYRATPVRRSFMQVAHCLWTLLFGYLGGKYAVWVDAHNLRRGRPEQA